MQLMQLYTGRLKSAAAENLTYLLLENVRWLPVTDLNAPMSKCYTMLYLVKL